MLIVRISIITKLTNETPLLTPIISPAYDCPEPTVYLADGATPVPTCLDKDPEQTGTVRGCFCPEGQFLQDGECVKADGCKCLYEGQFYDVSVNTRKYYFLVVKVWFGIGSGEGVGRSAGKFPSKWILFLNRISSCLCVSMEM